MFKIALIASLMALAVAQRYGGSHRSYAPAHGSYSAPAPSYGGGHHDDYAQPIPYQYGFDIVGGDHHSGDFKQTRQEHGDGHGNVQGSYSYTDAHGNLRHVDYVADGHGFRAQIRTNEPGTESQSPADVELHADPPRHQESSYGGHGGSRHGGSYGGHSGY